MEHKLLTKRGKELYKLQSKTVEPVFGQIKEGRCCKRLMRPSLTPGMGEWRLICATHNLLKLTRMGTCLGSRYRRDLLGLRLGPRDTPFTNIPWAEEGRACLLGSFSEIGILPLPISHGPRREELVCWVRLVRWGTARKDDLRSALN
jgi:hypothetical protein